MYQKSKLKQTHCDRQNERNVFNEMKSISELQKKSSLILCSRLYTDTYMHGKFPNCSSTIPKMAKIGESRDMITIQEISLFKYMRDFT